MSWNLYKSDDPSDKGIADMQAAIQEAGNEKILMFCATQDSGHTAHRDPYPATGCDATKLKRIGSAGIHGVRADYVHPNDVDYLFPGEIAMSAKNIVTGSSAATSLAAGLAGLILWCCALQERRRHLNDELRKTSTAAQEVKKESSARRPPQRSKSVIMMEPPQPQPQQSFVDFQSHERMYGLFDELISDPNNPLVNITSILLTAARSDDPARELVRLCRQRAYKYFETGSTAPTNGG